MDDLSGGTGRGPIHINLYSDVGGKCRYFSERSKSFSERIDDFIEKLQCFFEYNPSYKRNGLFQIAISAKMDVASFQVGENDYVDGILISKLPIDGMNLYVANLNEVRLGNVAGSFVKRCHYSRTYYLEEKNSKFEVELLWDNDAWLSENDNDTAIRKLVAKKKGRMLNETPKGWYLVFVNGAKDIGYVWYYADENGKEMAILVMVNSGAIVDIASNELILLEKIERINGEKVYANTLLKFRFENNKTLKRVRGL